MTTYHRYVIANGASATLEELRLGVRQLHPSIDIEGEVVTVNGIECGILVDVAERGDPVFEDDIDLLERLARRDTLRDDIMPILKSTTCMVTTQVISTADEAALEAIWTWLHNNRVGMLAYEGGGFRIDT